MHNTDTMQRDVIASSVDRFEQQMERLESSGNGRLVWWIGGALVMGAVVIGTILFSNV